MCNLPANGVDRYNHGCKFSDGQLLSARLREETLAFEKEYDNQLHCRYLSLWERAGVG